MAMGRQEGSPLFAESIANYDNRRSRGRKKLLIGAITIGVAILLTLAIAIPLSTDKNKIPNSTLLVSSPIDDANSQSPLKLASSQGQGQPEMILKLSKKHTTNDPCDAEDDSEDKSWNPRTKSPHHHKRTTGKTDGGDDDDDSENSEDSESSDDSHSYDPDRHWPPRPRTRRPWWPRTTKKDDKTDHDEDPHDGHKTRRPHRRTTKKTDDGDDDDSERSDDSHSYDPDRHWPPRPRTRRPWWPRTTRKRDDEDDDDGEESDDHPWRPKTRKPWWPTRSTTEKKTTHSSTTPLPDETTLPTTHSWIHESTTGQTEDEIQSSTQTMTSEPTSTTTSESTSTTTSSHITNFPTQKTPTNTPSDQSKCHDVPMEYASRIEIDHFANVWWYEQARVQSSVSQMPINLISCSKSYFEIKNVNGVYTPEGAKVTYTFSDNTGANKTFELNMEGTVSFSRWLEYYDDKEIQLSFVTRLNDSLLTYECSPSKYSSASYALRIWSLEPKNTLDSAAQSLMTLVDVAGLNPSGLAFREIDQSDC